MRTTLVVLTAMLFLSGCDSIELESQEKTKAFFGDKVNDRVVIVDVEDMQAGSPVEEVYTGHLITYAVDKVHDLPKVYVSNRGSNALDVIDTDSSELTGTVQLQHFPRSADAMNESLDLCEVSGMDKAMATIIDVNSDEIVSVVGENITVDSENNINHGGSHACGHPFWLDDSHFALIDRFNRKISTYRITKETNGDWMTTKLNDVDTTTSVHHIVKNDVDYLGENNYFYAVAEGSDDEYPSIIELRLTSGIGLSVRREVSLIKEGVDTEDMTAHHGRFHPFEKSIYVGSAEGNLFVVDYDDMSIKNILDAGKGAGHVKMVPAKELAVVINHKDVFVTIVDLLTNEKIADVNVSSDVDSVGVNQIQAHTAYHVSEDSQYFYSFLTEEGKFYKVDLDALEMVEDITLGGKITQGSFISY